MPELPFSQAAQNNKGPILAILQQVLSKTSTVLEIGSGTGQHAVWFAYHLPHLTWQPSEQQINLDALHQRFEIEAPVNILDAVVVDVANSYWPVEPVEAVFSANCVHIMSWTHVRKMFERLDRTLKVNGHLILYGPYKYNGKFTSPSNAAFDLWLKGNDQQSGIRDFEKIDALAKTIGLLLLADHQMPANNQCLVWQRVMDK